MKFRFRHLKELTWDDVATSLKEAFRTGQIKEYRPAKGREFPFSETVMDIKVVTICEIENDKREILAQGFAFCGPFDQFNKKIGRNIAKNRAVNSYNEACEDAMD